MNRTDRAENRAARQGRRQYHACGTPVTGGSMSEDFEREVLRRVPLDRRAFIKKMVVGAAFAAPVIASFNMVGLGAGSAQGLTPNAISRQELLCDRKIAERNQLQHQISSLSPNAPAALKARLQKRLDAVNAYIAAHC